MLRGVTVLGRARASIGPCAPDYAGVLVDSPAGDLATAPVLAQDRVVDIVSRGCRSGFFPGAFALASFPEESGNGLVLDSSAVVRTTRIQRPGEEAIVIAGTDTHALLSHVLALGRAPSFDQPQGATESANGIDILDPGAVVDIRDSEIRDFTFQFTTQGHVFNIEYGVKANPGTTLRLVRSIVHNDTVGVGLLGAEGGFVADDSIHDNDIDILATTGASGNRVLRNLVVRALGPTTGSILGGPFARTTRTGRGRREPRTCGRTTWVTTASRVRRRSARRLPSALERPRAPESPRSSPRPGAPRSPLATGARRRCGGPRPA
jgi:hypothetical protein